MLELLAEEAARPFEAGEMDGNLVESPAGHMMLKKVIAHDAKREQDCRYSVCTIQCSELEVLQFHFYWIQIQIRNHQKAENPTPDHCKKIFTDSPASSSHRWTTSHWSAGSVPTAARFSSRT